MTTAPLTTADVAALAGLEPVTIRYHVQMGNLHGKRIGSQWLFERADVDRWLAVPRRRGKPAAAPYKPRGDWTVVSTGVKAKTVHVLALRRHEKWDGRVAQRWTRSTLAEAVEASGLPLCQQCGAKVDGA